MSQLKKNMFVVLLSVVYATSHFVVPTLAYFNDTEEAADNSFIASSLDFSLFDLATFGLFDLALITLPPFYLLTFSPRFTTS